MRLEAMSRRGHCGRRKPIPTSIAERSGLRAESLIYNNVWEGSLAADGQKVWHFTKTNILHKI